MKKILCCLLALLLIGGCSSVKQEETEDTLVEEEVSDQTEETNNEQTENESSQDQTYEFTYRENEAEIFKEAYESLNGLQDIKYPDQVYRTVTIDEDNPFIETTMEEVIYRIVNGETFYLYFGDPKCPWCRSNIEAAVTNAKADGIKQIFYVQMWDENRNEIVRDKYEAIDGELEKTVESNDGYEYMLVVLDDYLNEYIVEDDEGNTYDTGEKRIVMPSYIHFTNGVVDKYSEATASSQTDSHGELTEEIIAEQNKDFGSLFNQTKACSLNSKGC